MALDNWWNVSSPRAVKRIRLSLVNWSTLMVLDSWRVHKSKVQKEKQRRTAQLIWIQFRIWWNWKSMHRARGIIPFPFARWKRGESNVFSRCILREHYYNVYHCDYVNKWWWEWVKKWTWKTVERNFKVGAIGHIKSVQLILVQEVQNISHWIIWEITNHIR